jgi:hypothetical protein
MSEDLMIEDDFEEEKPKRRLTDTQRKALTYGIIIIVAFSFGCGLVGFSMRASEKSPRKDLAATDNYIKTIFSYFEAEVYNSTSEEFSTYGYVFISNSSTFENSGGEVTFNDIQESLEYVTIYYPPAVPENTITEITFYVKEKSQLNIIIFADGREVHNALRIKSDINIDLTIPATEIVVYIF